MNSRLRNEYIIKLSSEPGTRVNFFASKEF